MRPNNDAEYRAQLLGDAFAATKGWAGQWSPELRADIEAADAPCLHPSSQYVFYSIAGGAKQTRRECLFCGDVFGNPLPQQSNLPRWDAERFAAALEKNTAAKKAIFARHAELQKKDLKDRRAEHAAYLQSPEWREKRRLVLDRAKGMCDGCRVNRATQVHHLTYRHWGRELLFELVALCDGCHALCHEDRQPDD